MSDQKIIQPGVAVPTVVWGVIVLVIAVGAFLVATLDVREFTVAGIVWAVIGVGALLIVAALIGAITRAGRAASTDRLTDQ